MFRWIQWASRREAVQAAHPLSSWQVVLILALILGFQIGLVIWVLFNRPGG